MSMRDDMLRCAEHATAQAAQATTEDERKLWGSEAMYWLSAAGRAK